MVVWHSKLHMVWICWWNNWNLAYNQVRQHKATNRFGWEEIRKSDLDGRFLSTV